MPTSPETADPQAVRNTDRKIRQRPTCPGCNITDIQGHYPADPRLMDPANMRATVETMENGQILVRLDDADFWMQIYLPAPA